MEKLIRNFHVKLQEMCDCYMDSDFVAEIQKAATGKSTMLEEDALKYFALTILYTLTVKAQQLKISRDGSKLSVTVLYNDKETSLPVPSDEIAMKILEIIRNITHIDTNNGELPFVLGLPSGQIDLQVKIKKDESNESIELGFPAL